MEKVDESVFIPQQDIVPRHAKKEKKKFPFKKVALVVVLLLVLFVIYELVFNNKINNIKVINNRYLSETYIKEICGISESDNYWLLGSYFKEKQAKSDPLINNIDISTAAGHTVIIDVSENTIVGYQADASSGSEGAKLLLADGKIIDFSAAYMKNIAVIPLFVNVSEENSSAIAQQLGKLDMDIIARISEVTTVAFTYEANMVKLTMDDGYKVFSSIPGLGYMSSYFDIVVHDTQQTEKCILIIAEYSRAVITNCEEIESYYQENE